MRPRLAGETWSTWSTTPKVRLRAAALFKSSGPCESLLVSCGSNVTLEASDLQKLSDFIRVFDPTEFSDVQ